MKFMGCYMYASEIFDNLEISGFEKSDLNCKNLVCGQFRYSESDFVVIFAITCNFSASETTENENFPTMDFRSVSCSLQGYSYSDTATTSTNTT